MTAYYAPTIEAKKEIEEKTLVNASLCWSCSACDSECPVFLGSSRLRPQRVLHMASLGLLDELVGLPEIWYCLACKRCTKSCPNDCEPETILGFLIKEAIRTHLYPDETIDRYNAFCSKFQRVRWRAVDACLKGGDVEKELASNWEAWLEEPVSVQDDEIILKGLNHTQPFIDEAARFATSACFNCSECTNSCPICFERKVFDPQWIFRMVNLGLEEEILRSPGVWLCISCQTCTSVCSQLVSGHLMIRGLQEMAVKEGVVEPEFPERWRRAQTLLYPLFTKEIDGIFGFTRN
jgi:heterodisulfide reductase subunit C